jgi:hypothetical protein
VGEKFKKRTDENMVSGKLSNCRYNVSRASFNSGFSMHLKKVKTACVNLGTVELLDKEHSFKQLADLENVSDINCISSLNSWEKELYDISKVCKVTYINFH